MKWPPAEAPDDDAYPEGDDQGVVNCGRTTR